MENQICEKCTHFYRHYIKRGKSYFPINYGHCVYPRIKNRECNTLACGKFALSKEFSEKWEESRAKTP